MREIKIGLTGKMRAGKDTVADYLVENYKFERFGFGKALKEFADEIFGVDESQKPREVYQRFGQYCRDIDGEVWIRKCFEEIASREYSKKVWSIESIDPFRPVITDIRQPNEFARCRAEGFTIIRVVADDRTRLKRAQADGDVFDAETLNHETEQYIDSFNVDFEIENNGRWRDMAEQVDVIMRELTMKEAAN